MRKFSVLISTILLGITSLAGLEIHLPDSPTVVEKKAAEELQHYLTESLGTASCTRNGKEVIFHLGDTPVARYNGIKVDELAEEEWIIRSDRENVILAGGGIRGTLYAVYHFLEDVLQVHWWTQQEESIPNYPDGLPLPDLNWRGIPAFRQRDIYRSWNNMEPDGGRFAARNRLNRDGDQVIRPEFGGSVTYGKPYFVHTFNLYFPEEQYFAEHPEFFALHNGQREAGPTSQLCLSNMEMREELFRRLQEFILADEEQAKVDNVPAPLIYDISANDARNPCECPECRKIVEREGAESGVLLDCINDIAGRLKKFRPNLFISTLAYYHTETPPKNLRAADNVIIRLCDTATNQAQPFTAQENQPFLTLLKQWSHKAKQLGIWDYSITYMIPSGPFPHEYTLAENIKLYRDNGVQFLFWEHESVECADMHAVNVWLEAKLMENPDADFEQLLHTFLTGYYGEAAPMIAQYRKLLRDSALRNKTNINWFANPPAFTHVDYETAAASQQLFDDAERAVASNPVLLKRVRRARLNLDRICGLNLRRLISQFIDITGKTPADCPLDRDTLAERAHATWTATIRELVAPEKQEKYLKQADAEYELVRKIEFVPFRKPSKFAGLNYVDLPAEETQLFSNKIQIVSDQTAEAGCAVRIPRDNEIPLKGAMYVPLTGQGGAAGKITVDDIPGPGYHWYHFATIKPQQSAYYYFTSDWTTQFPLNSVVANDTDDRPFELWVSVKFTGPAYPFGDQSEENAVWIERIVLIKSEK